jgi:hypothetical protein
VNADVCMSVGWGSSVISVDPEQLVAGCWAGRSTQCDSMCSISTGWWMRRSMRWRSSSRRGGRRRSSASRRPSSRPRWRRRRGGGRRGGHLGYGIGCRPGDGARPAGPGRGGRRE